jgi:hypothetical protein
MRSMIRLAVMALALQIATAVAGFGAAAEGAVPLSAEARTAEVLLAVVQAFRQTGKSDMSLAVKRHTLPSGARAFARIDKTAWRGLDPRVGWSHFMLVSVVTLIPGGEDRGDAGTAPLVAFYNPWSDVFLVTQWQFAKGGPRIADAEILLGDWVRRRGEGPIRSVPLWLRGGKALPAGPTIAAADSMLALEGAFEDWKGKDWRGHLGGFSDRDSVADNLVVAGEVMRLAIWNPVRAFAGDSDEALRGLREALAELLKELSEGGGERVLAGATETLPAMRALIAELPKESLLDLIPVAVFVSGTETRVFMVPKRSPDFVFHVLFRRDGGRLERRRVDLVSYQETYEWRRLGSPEIQTGGSR